MKARVTVLLVALLLAAAAVAQEQQQQQQQQQPQPEQQQQQQVQAPPAQESSQPAAKGGSESSESGAPSGGQTPDDPDSDEDQLDWVGRIIDNIKTGMKAGIIQAGGAKVTIVDNSNVAKHEEPNFEKLGEHKFKESQEEAKKEHREGNAKRTSEQSLKKEEQFSKKKVIEVRKEVNKEVRDMEVEQDQKSLQEQTEKTNESKSKQSVEQGAKRQVEETRRAIDQAGRRAEGEMANKRVAEQTEKRRGIDKVADEVSKDIKDAQNKAVEEQQKKEQEQAQKRNEGGNKRQQEEEQKRRRKNKPMGEGRWCNCQSVGVNHHVNSWTHCPNDKLLVGIHRSGDQSLNGMTHFHCCQPCAQDGNHKKMKVGDCYQADWVHSFDRPGWSRCRDNYYVRGLYRSSCNLIYCIEYAQCCSIKNSRGQRNCHAQGRWGTSFDRPGWSMADHHYFINGFHRSGGHWLYNIEHPMQCLV